MQAVPEPEAYLHTFSSLLIVLTHKTKKRLDYILNTLHQTLHNTLTIPMAASGPPASNLLGPNCYSFTMCFCWVSMCIPGLIFMRTIHRQLGQSLLQAQFLTFTFIFGAVHILTFCRL